MARCTSAACKLWFKKDYDSPQMYQRTYMSHLYSVPSPLAPTLFLVNPGQWVVRIQRRSIFWVNEHGTLLSHEVLDRTDITTPTCEFLFLFCCIFIVCHFFSLSYSYQPHSPQSITPLLQWPSFSRCLHHLYRPPIVLIPTVTITFETGSYRGMPERCRIASGSSMQPQVIHAISWVAF